MSNVLPFVLLLLQISIIVYCRKHIRTAAGIPPFGGDGNLAVDAFLSNPSSAFATSWGEVYIADTNNHVIRKVDRNAIISTVAGTPALFGPVTNGTAREITFNTPSHIHVDDRNNLYVTDTGNQAIRKILPSGQVLTIAGGNGQGNQGDNGLATNSQLNNPSSSFFWNEQVYVCDKNNHAIRVILGNGTIVTRVGILGQAGYSPDGTIATQAVIHSPHEVFVTSDEEIFFSESGSVTVRKVLKNNTIITVAGSLTPFSQYQTQGNALELSLQSVKGIYVSQQNELYICDGQWVRKVYLHNQTMLTIAGFSYGVVSPPVTHTGDFGPATLAKLSLTSSVSLIAEGEVIIADPFNRVIRKVTLEGIIVPFAGVNPSSNKANPKYQNAALGGPKHVYVSPSTKAIYVADISYSTGHIRVFTSANAFIVVGQRHGLPPSFTTCPINGFAIGARLEIFKHFSVHEPTGDIFITYSDMLARVIPSTNSFTTLFCNLNLGDGPLAVADDGTITFAESMIIRQTNVNGSSLVTIAGQNGIVGCSGDGGSALNATFSNPTKIQIDKNNDIYILDSICRSIRKIDSNTMKISTFAVLPLEVSTFVLWDEQYYLASYRNAVVKIHVNGTITSVLAGSISSANSFSGDYQDPLQATLSNPSGLFVTENGAIFIADTGNKVIRHVGDVCDDYNFVPKLNFSVEDSNIKVEVQFNRTCKFDSDFDTSYLPIQQTKLKYFDRVLNSFAFTNWGQSVAFQSSIIGQYLDIVNVILDGCNRDQQIITNCSSSKEVVGVVPTSSPLNFYLLESITSFQFVHFFKFSPWIKSFLLTMELVNLATNQTIIQEITAMDRNTFTIEQLAHSSMYQVNIQTNVTYRNGMQYASTVFSQNLRTKIGILPTATVSSFDWTHQEGGILLTWLPVPENERGNVHIETIVFDVTMDLNSNEQSNTVYVSYDAETNTPNFYLLSSIPSNKPLLIRAKVCSEIGCSNFSEPLQAMYIPTTQPNTEQINIPAIIGGLVGSSIVICCCIFVLLLFIIGLFIIIVKESKKKTTTYSIQKIHEQEMIENLKNTKYHIDESKIDFSSSALIGSGASGSVITAKYFGNEVAIKIVASQSIFGDTNSSLDDFYNELEFLSSNVQHPNIIRFFGIYSNAEKHQLGLMMEYCSNGSVANYICIHSLSFEQKIAMLTGIANGMQYLHHHNIAHRDLKCENVLLDSNLIPKIIDFGFSRVMQEETNKSMNLTMNVGTAAYCAPEVIHLQLHGTSTFETTMSAEGSVKATVSSQSQTTSNMANYNKQCDVYSFAIVMYCVYYETKDPYGANINANQLLYYISTNNLYRPKIVEDPIDSQHVDVTLHKFS